MSLHHGRLPVSRRIIPNPPLFSFASASDAVLQQQLQVKCVKSCSILSCSPESEGKYTLAISARLGKGGGERKGRGGHGFSTDALDEHGSGHGPSTSFGAFHPGAVLSAVDGLEKTRSNYSSPRMPPMLASSVLPSGAPPEPVACPQPDWHGDCWGKDKETCDAR